MYRATFATLLTLTLSFAVSMLFVSYHRVNALSVPEYQLGLLVKRFEPGSLLFVGDIMLGRAVERLMDEKGTSTPFAHVGDLVASYDLAIGNFESSVPEIHDPTEPLTMRFSVKPGSLGYLKEVGFDVLSLSNNHALDHGEQGYMNTRSVCYLYEVTCAGHPVAHDASSVVYKKVGDTKVAILMLHTLFEKPSTSTLALLLDEMSGRSDLQYVFVHWGDEYVLTHNDTQEELAHFLIDNGADAVIGHHPHVTQDVEEYAGKPIFYSLGNFIFDQYFSDEVQEGYAVSIAVTKRTVSYSVIPYSSRAERSVPKLVDGDERTKLLERVFPEGRFSSETRKTGTMTYAR